MLASIDWATFSINLSVNFVQCFVVAAEAIDVWWRDDRWATKKTINCCHPSDFWAENQKEWKMNKLKIQKLHVQKAQIIVSSCYSVAPFLVCFARLVLCIVIIFSNDVILNAFKACANSVYRMRVIPVVMVAQHLRDISCSLSLVPRHFASFHFSFLFTHLTHRWIHRCTSIVDCKSNNRTLSHWWTQHIFYNGDS